MNLTASLNPVHVEHLGAWLVDLVNTSVQFPSLQTLRLFSTSTQICLSTLIVLIQRTAPTLSSLNFPIYLTSEEVDRLLDALTEVQVQGANGRQSKLKTLIIHVTLLSVPFLDLLARKLPQLEFLTLFITEIIGSDQDSFYDLLRRRCYNRPTDSGSPSKDILHTWKLRCLSIWCKGVLSPDAMCAVAGAVPSILLP